MKKDIDGVYIPFGVKTSHTWHEIGAIFQIIEDYEVRCFIELGTFQGGLTLLLNAKFYFSESFNYLGVELDRNLVHPLAKKICDITYGDVFSDEIQRMVRNLIRNTGKVLVYCDNGDKIREMREYSKFLKPGDIIMCHDYYDRGDEVRDLHGFGKTLEFPKPEVFPEDLYFIRKQNFIPLPYNYTRKTRIAGFIKK